jgi:hypothetical protein
VAWCSHHQGVVSASVDVFESLFVFIERNMTKPIRLCKRKYFPESFQSQTRHVEHAFPFSPLPKGEGKIKKPPRGGHFGFLIFWILFSGSSSRTS